MAEAETVKEAGRDFVREIVAERSSGKIKRHHECSGLVLSDQCIQHRGESVERVGNYACGRCD